MVAESNTPMCPDCGSDGRRVGLDTSPPVYQCRVCRELFTRDGREPAENPRAARRRIVRCWDQILDDVKLLERAIKTAPDGTFPDEVRDGLLHQLDVNVWFVFANYRPGLPARPRGRRRAAPEKGGA